MTSAGSVLRSTPRLRAKPVAALVAIMAVIAVGLEPAAPATQQTTGVDFATLAGMVATQDSGDFFLKVDGIEGSSVRDGHEDEIEFSSMKWGVSNGATNGSAAGKPVFANLALASASTGKAGPPLMQAAASGQVIKQVTFSARRTIEGETSDFLVITLSDVIVSSYQAGDTGTSKEQVELSFSKIVINYDDGTAVAGWDLKAGRPV
ncbi:Hcp family type VI secretion system effector [Actinokineospora xionganensis]|uniref:Type VI secretion system tube protein Hcp n=1 Tax=Actinokineospora xionganensis TaxID=2684470 RepID=A0ABR7LDX8_9PSEU|nr:type VI secretion system tube protein Hcp [Actinokineospora xionganensis]MBC6450901.1 type VI secretion system tube protein Hcp [Actinokineospora xionganensis]